MDVAVVGGGVVGAACARAAALRGLRAVVLEPGRLLGAASPASAGMLAAQVESADDAQLSLFVRARDRYVELAPALEDSTGIAVGLWRAGVAALALDDIAAARLRETAVRQRTQGFVAEWLTADQMRARDPGVTPDCRGAFLSPHDGAVDPEALARALLADAERLGVLVIPERVERIRIAATGVAGVSTAARDVVARHVVLAAGVWSPMVPGPPRRVPVEPVRGQLVATPWPLGTPPAILYHDHCYVLARGAEAVLGSTMERVGFDARATAEGIAGIVQRTAAILPVLAGLPITRAWAGLRPVTPDGHPVVGPDPEVRGLWYATGHGRNGILLAALTGDVIAEWVATGTPGVDVSSWRVDRFQTDG